MDYDEFREKFDKLRFVKNYQQVIIKTLLESPSFTTHLKHLKEELDHYNPGYEKHVNHAFCHCYDVGIKVLEERKIVKIVIL